MDFKNIEKIEKKVKKPTFGEDFNSLNKLLRVLSFLGNGASVVLASFFVTTLLLIAISNYWVALSLSVIALIGLELTKREVFHRFSRDFIRTKKVFQASAFSMLFFTACLIGMSFYSTLSGAQKITSKQDEFVDSAAIMIETHSDSIRKEYSDRISNLENQNNTLFQQNIKIDERMDNLPTNYVTERKRLREEKKYHTDLIRENEDRILIFRNRMNQEIEKYKEEVGQSTDRNILKNKQDSITFVAISTIIEFLILIGVYFNNLYNFRSNRDHRLKLTENKQYKEHFNMYNFIKAIYTNRENGDVIPDNNRLKKTLELNKIYLNNSEIDDFIDILKQLQIIEDNSEKRFLTKTKIESEELINNYYE